MSKFSEQQLQRRLEKQFSISYPETLPVSEKSQDIVELLERHQVLVIAGETGSGKTTQIPKMCLQAGFGRKAMIGHTQPRRLAATSVAERIAEELGETVGEAVAWQVRFTDHTSEDTAIKLMTDGILLAEIANDPLLEKYDAIIIDEAHERSLNIDFLLGYLKRTLQKRKDLRVIITSATIDVEAFSQFFDDAPVVKVSGKTWPVDIAWFSQEHWRDKELASGVAEACEKILEAERAGETHEKDGDILVFLPGEKEIRDCHKKLKRSQQLSQVFDILPLYARLGFKDQQQVFKPKSRRRIVLSTNVAETSLTVPRIHYVIDSGLVRMSRYSYRNKLQQLPIEKISQASANQRSGRCGRVAPGLAIRLYDEQDYLASDQYTDPEIYRTNLASVILRMEYLRLGHVSRFPFIQLPDKRQINDGYRLLQEIKAVNHRRHITSEGKKIAALPCDPRLARMLLEASRQGALKEMLVICSALAIQDPRETPADKLEASRQKHQRFADKKSDFISWLNLWNYIEEQRQELSASQFRKLCQQEYFSWLRLREWREIHRQLLLFCKQLKLQLNKKDASYEKLHKAVLSGLITQIGMKDDKGYLGTRNRRFVVFPASPLKKTKAKWLVAAELIETSQVFARTVAEIEPEWLMPYAEHLFKSSYSEPHYNPSRGQVLAKQNLSLFGLPVMLGTSVNYASIDKQLARDIFIREAFVEAKYKHRNAEFFKHNQKLLDEIGEYEIRQRRPDLLVDDEVLFEFYSERIPQQVHNLAGFESWRKTQEKTQPKVLFFEREQLMNRELQEKDLAAFPETMSIEGMDFPLSYRFHPGKTDDGVTVDVPLAVINRIADHAFDRLVPGLLEEKVTEMVRLLPKQIRKHLVPIPDFIKSQLQQMQSSDLPLRDAVLECAMSKQHNKNVRPESLQWPLDKLDDYYLMRIRLLDDKGEEITSGRNFAELKKSFRQHSQQLLRKGSSEKKQNGLQKQDVQAWDFGDLPEVHRYRQGSVEVYSYPALVDYRESVAIELFDSALLAQQQHWKGLARLVLLQDKKQWRYLKTLFPKANAQQLQARYFIPVPELIDDALLQAVFLACFQDNQAIFSQAGFESSLKAGRSRIVAKTQQLQQILADILQQRYLLEQQINKPVLSRYPELKKDIASQLQALLPDHFLIETPSELIPELPRYLKAMVHRLENLQGQLNKDKQAMGQISQLQQLLSDYLKENPHAMQENPKVSEFRWLIEELRVSLFAQRLGTRKPVSFKRLSRFWSETIAN